MKKQLTYTLITVAIVGIIIMSVGYFRSLRATTHTNPRLNTSNTLNVLIIGDSIAKGTGDEKGKGLTGNLTDTFKISTSKQVHINNLGIDGLKSSGLLEQLQSKKWDQSVAESDLILISIGGNDLQSLLNLNSIAQKDALLGIMDSYLNNLKQSLKQIRAVNPKATIIFLGLYNPFEKLTSTEAQILLEVWNYRSLQLIKSDSQAIFVPTNDLIKDNIDQYIAKDGLHPNASGYQAISNQIAQAVKSIQQ